MSKINVLSFEIANLIAAGEVVERPASVLKELIENSIDSGADRIVAEIKHGGVSLIRVSDNGCGMEKEDLPIALRRHATSKIREKDDLSKIMTLGFRGEALAAIASVSQLTIISKTADSDTANMLTSAGGEILDVSDVGAADGTTVVVENLFYNVPARRKFLKKDSTEAMNVAALVERVALSRPDISIQLLIDGEEKFKTPGDGVLINTVRAIFGKEFTSKLIEADGEANGIHVHGFIGRSDNVRKNRNLENIFINGRYVKSHTAIAALEKAFTSYIAPECFPACVLFIEMNPSVVDVNVHPAKLEVKFSDERIVFESVYYTVKSALENYSYRPEIKLGTQKKEQNPLGAFVPIGDTTRHEQLSLSELNNVVPKETVHIQRPRVSYPENNSSFSEPERRDYTRPVAFASPSLEKKNSVNASDGANMTPRDSIELLKKYGSTVGSESIPKRIISESEKMREESISAPEYKYVGEAFNCYVMIEFDGDLLIIDKHAAHERIIFEDLKRKRAADNRLVSQALLLPISVILSPDELSAAEEYRDEIEACGFEYTVNERSVDINAVPEAISARDAEGLFVKMADELLSGKGNPENTEAIRRERALYQIACKAAIKGGRIYDRPLIEWLIARVLALPDITVCPHGRPIAYRMKKNELDRQFDRIK